MKKKAQEGFSFLLLFFKENLDLDTGHENARGWAMSPALAPEAPVWPPTSQPHFLPLGSLPYKTLVIPNYFKFREHLSNCSKPQCFLMESPSATPNQTLPQPGNRNRASPTTQVSCYVPCSRNSSHCIRTTHLHLHFYTQVSYTHSPYDN